MQGREKSSAQRNFACPHLSCLWCFVISPSGSQRSSPTRKISSLCASHRLLESRVLKHAGKRGKMPEFTEASITLVQKPNGSFFDGGRNKFTAFSAPGSFPLPSCTNSIFILLVQSRQKQSVAMWREGNLVQNTPVYECVCKLKLKLCSPFTTLFHR